MTDQTCEICKWWQQRKEHDQTAPGLVLGECHRHAPALTTNRDFKYMSKWPSTKSTDFCGSFKAIKAEPVKPEFPENQKCDVWGNPITKKPAKRGWKFTW